MKILEGELKSLKQEITAMFLLVQSQMEKVNAALIKFDKDLAREIISTEKRVNAQELNIDRECENIFSLYQPVAIDLRLVLAILKINNNLERVGDIAEGIAKFVVEANNPFHKDLLEKTGIIKMFEEVLLMVDLIETAFTNEDTALARSMFVRDEVLNNINMQAVKNVADYIKQYPDNVEEALFAVSIVRKLERVGDQITNIAEEIIFSVEAKVLKHSKKKQKQ